MSEWLVVGEYRVEGDFVSECSGQRREEGDAGLRLNAGQGDKASEFGMHA